MDNYLFLKRSKELEELSKKLGFENTYFLDDFVLVKSKKELLKATGRIIFVPNSEEELRFALEKSRAEIILGVEKIHYKDSVHYLRGGLDQVLCKIAAERGKKIGFSPFSDLGRTMFNLKICKKYKVNVIFSNFCSSKMEMRSKDDLKAMLRILKY